MCSQQKHIALYTNNIDKHSITVYTNLSIIKMNVFLFFPLQTAVNRFSPNKMFQIFFQFEEWITNTSSFDWANCY